MFVFTVFVLHPAGLISGFLELGRLSESQLAPTGFISQGELRHGWSEIAICSEGLILFSSDCCTADRVGSTASLLRRDGSAGQSEREIRCLCVILHVTCAVIGP